MSDIYNFILVLARSFFVLLLFANPGKRRKVVKGNLRIFLSSIVLFSLISCGSVNKPSSSNINDSSTDSSIEEPSSSDSSEEKTSSQESSSEQSSIQSSSEEASSSEAPSSSESSSESSIPEGTYYHVTFVNYDDSVLYEVDVLEGTEAIYSGETPIKPEDDEFTYEFKGWDQDLTNIQAEMTTKAEYSYTPKENWGSIIWF